MMCFLSRSQNNFKLSALSTSLLAIAFMICVHPVYCVTKPLDRGARTLYYNNRTPNEKGDYNFEFQTSNGITTKAAGNAYGASGVVQFVSLEGLPITMTYVADANGYHPSGEHIPDFIERSLEYIRTHEPVNEKESRKL